MQTNSGDGAVASCASLEPEITSIEPAAPLHLKPGAAVLALDAALLTTIGSSIRGHLLFLIGVPVTVAACIVAWTAAGHPHDRSLSFPYFLLAVACGVGLVVPSPGGAFWYELLFRALPAIGVIAVGVASSNDARLRRRATLVVVTTAVAVHLLAPIGVRQPRIDVWTWTQAATTALLHGVHPYTVSAVDPYRGAYDFGSTPTVFPYMPAVLLLAAPSAALFGDYRYSTSVCLPVTFLLFTAAARRLGTDEETTSVGLLTLALQPRGGLLAAMGFTDLLLVATAAVFLYSAVRRWRVCEASAFLLLPGLKQYVAAPALLYALLRPRWKSLMLGGLLVAGTVLPFVLWNARATFAGILYLARAPIGFRIDSDAVTALVAQISGLTSPRWLAIAAEFVAAAVAGWMVRDRGLAGILLASAMSLLVCFLVATQSFANYYVFVTALLVFASALFAGRTAVV